MSGYCVYFVTTFSVHISSVVTYHPIFWRRDFRENDIIFKSTKVNKWFSSDIVPKIKSLHILASYFLKGNFNIIIPLMFASSVIYFPFWCSGQNFMHCSCSINVTHAPPNLSFFFSNVFYFSYWIDVDICSIIYAYAGQVQTFYKLQKFVVWCPTCSESGRRVTSRE